MTAKSFLMLAAMVFGNVFTRPDLQADEVFEFYPASAAWDAEREHWQAEIHTSVYEPELDSLRRRALMAILIKVLDLDKKQLDTELFKRRVQPFLVDHGRGIQVRIRLADKIHDAGTSQADGQAFGSIEFPTALPGNSPQVPQWLTYHAELPESDRRQFSGSIQCIPPRGVTIVSDVDDTIKLSDVTNRRELVKNTFLLPFRAVPGMADQYRVWEQQGAAFHYLSASPWQLYQPLEEFRQAERFPQGVWSMKQLRLTDRSVLDFFGNQTAYKAKLLKPLFAAYPERIFVLIGDSGEQDPEIFGALARDFPNQVKRIFIRESQQQASPADRWERAFDQLPRETWHVFTEASELADQIPAAWFAPLPVSK